jgi:hypothetical protein
MSEGHNAERLVNLAQELLRCLDSVEAKLQVSETRAAITSLLVQVKRSTAISIPLVSANLVDTTEKCGHAPRVGTIYVALGQVLQPDASSSPALVLDEQIVMMLSVEVREALQRIRNAMAGHSWLFDDIGRAFQIKAPWTKEKLFRFRDAVSAESGAAMLMLPSIEFAAGISQSTSERHIDGTSQTVYETSHIL